MQKNFVFERSPFTCWFPQVAPVFAPDARTDAGAGKPDSPAYPTTDSQADAAPDSAADATPDSQAIAPADPEAVARADAGPHAGAVAGPDGGRGRLVGQSRRRGGRRI